MESGSRAALSASRAPPPRLEWGVTADTAERFLGEWPRVERECIRRELERVDALLLEWQEHDSDRALPPEYRRYPPVPEVPRERLRARYDALVKELTGLP